MSSDIRTRGGGGSGGGGGGGGGFDPSNLHLKKELTQIRKAARVLRDPGTSSSWRSPLNSARSTAAKHYYHHHKQNDFSKQYGKNGENLSQIPLGLVQNNTDINSSINGKNNVYEANNGSNGKEKEKDKKKVYLYNWKLQRSESERSRQCGDEEAENGNGDMVEQQSSSSSREVEESVEDSLSDARNNGGGIDSKSDTYVSDKYGSMIFKCKDTNFTPPIRRSIKKKSKKSDLILRNHGEKLKEQILLARGSKRVLEGLGRDDLSRLVDQSDGTEDYCNSEDLRRASASSPLLVKLKNKNWTSSSAKLLRSSRKEDSSYSYSTPAMSTRSYNRYVAKYPSTVGSWDATTVSLNDGDDEVDDQLDLPGRQGCGIPCYWSRRSTPKHKGGSSSCFSPSLSDTLRRTGSTILCGSHEMYKRSRRGSSLGYNKRRPGSSRAAVQGLLPLLTNNGDGWIGSSIGTGNSDDELSTNYGELDLEALSRLDGRRWSTSCRSQEGLELVALTGEEEEGSPENIRSLSQKYRPMFFEELIGQNIVVQSLMNVVSRKRIAPVYLFQGPRGTGKTSTARVFGAALNCLASEETKPCGVCRECADFVSGKSRCLVEVDGANKKGIDSIRYLFKSLMAGSLSAFSWYKVLVVNECHLLPAKTWMALLKFLEEPPPHVVLILITTDLDNVPRTVLSRCQKYLFNKIRDSDILARLRKIAAEESLDVESDALDLIALNADGSLRDAETMLDQLSLLGKRITTSLVNELVGVVSDDKLLELLDLAMSSDTAETVKRARELMDSGVDPIVLMSQMATLIMDIIAGTYPAVDAKDCSSFLGGRNLTEAELERLKRALKLLSEAEKQLRVSSERSTWFTATLLQLGSISSPDRTHSGSSRRQSSKVTEEDPSSTFKDNIAGNQQSDPQYALRKSSSPTSFRKAAYRKSNSKEVSSSLMDVEGFSSHITQNQPNRADALAGTSDDFVAENNISRSTASNMLDDIWLKCVEKCHSKTLRQLLHTYGKLVSISDVEGVFVAYIAFGDSDIKTRAERFHSSITNSFETVLKSNVEVRIVLLPDGDAYVSNLNPDTVLSPGQKPMNATNTLNRENMAILSTSADGYSNLDTCQESLKVSRGSFNDSEDKLAANYETSAGNAKMSDRKERKSGVPVQRIESIIHEQRLETAWLQAMEKGTPGSTSRLRPEKNQILPQEGIYHHTRLESSNAVDLSSEHWEDELSHDIRSLKVDDGKVLKKDQISKRVDRYPMSPSLLHDNLAGNFSKDKLGYESGPGGGGCSGIFCWNNTKHSRRAKVKQGTPVRSHKGVRFSWFGECAKAPRTESRFRI
ncbi:hypothetical protein ACH5RR_001801 [Cinchona calisaya]|uniref:DNA polymerase III gamma subunit domain-containing protein n=1 Tax=Cinchona calisaya TaxID=153742 RepID=A0ABD3B4H6_9GENT